MHGSWTGSREEDIDEDIQYSEYPFSIGLASIKQDEKSENTVTILETK